MTAIRNSVVLVLGGAGQVGFEIISELLKKNPKKIVICDLKKERVDEAIRQLRPKNGKTELVGEPGNIFADEIDKDKTLKEMISVKEGIAKTVARTFNPEDEEIEGAFLYRVILKHKPDIIVDAINTATSLAYQDPYEQIFSENDDEKWLRIAASMPIPQLIRHTRILFNAFRQTHTKIYLKMGTSGTGGLGFTLPYTHGENEVPSRLLMSKSAVAGAQTMLLWVLARTPMMPVIKEIKVAALIGWRNINQGEFITNSKPIPVYDCPVENSLPVEAALTKHVSIKMNQNLQGNWIDTGENGVFTKDMFKAITAMGCMELITPSEIAKVAVSELENKHTGKEIMTAIDRAVLGPTLIGNGMRQVAIDSMNETDDNYVASIQTLGPLTAKTLWEAALLKRAYGNIDLIESENESEIQKRVYEIISVEQSTRAKIISVGLPILLPNGEVLRGELMLVPGKNLKAFRKQEIERWIETGWIDLRTSNWVKWKAWLKEYGQKTNTKTFDTGEVCGWILAHKLGGIRVKR
jgi:hypothetical protein